MTTTQFITLQCENFVFLTEYNCHNVVSNIFIKLTTTELFFTLKFTGNITHKTLKSWYPITAQLHVTERERTNHNPQRHQLC